MKSWALISTAIFLLLSRLAAAQNCPAGIPSAGNPMCLPPDRSPYNQGRVESAPIKMQWADRWGAIAIDATVSEGGIGIVESMRDKRSAQKAALAQCRSTGGGSGCMVELAYFNQCAVLIWGDKKFNTVSAKTVELAANRGMERCREDDNNCQIFYSGCSLAERSQ